MNIENICEKPKRRGRPKKSYNKYSIKNNNYKKKNKMSDAMEHNEELILHLPIRENDIKNNKEPNIDTSDNVFTLNDDTTKEKNFITFTDMSSSEDEIDNNVLLEKDNKIQQLTKELNEYKQKNSLDKSNVIKYHTIVTNFIDINNNSSIDNNINNKIACWWCTYEYDNKTCYIPDKYCDNKYFVFGNFCSYNCAAAYNLSLGDYRIWDRHSLINKLYNCAYNCTTSVVTAPPKEILVKFGGPLTIEEYRKNFMINNKEFRIIFPTIEHLVVGIEETNKQEQNNNDKFNSLKIKRSKHLANSNLNVILSNVI